MGRLYIENDCFMYTDEEGTEILLDCDELISNYSSVPLQYLPAGADSLPGIILGGMKEHKTFAAGTKEEKADKEYATMEIFVAKEHMKTPYELKVLEIGCTSGILSSRLAMLIGKYSEKSQLCCVTDTIGNESGNHWVDKISMLNVMPKLSFLVTDYDCMPLPDDFFDIVIINGSVPFEKKEEMLSEASRVLKRDGVLLAYIVEDVELIQKVVARCNTMNYYMYMGDRCVIRAEACDFLEVQSRTEEVSYSVEEVMRCCEELMKADVKSEELRRFIKRLDAYVQEAIEKKDVDSKVLFMKYKGKLLDKFVRENE